MKIVEFKKELLTNWVYNGLEKDILGSDILPMAEFYSNLGGVYIGLVDERVIGLGGIFKLWQGIGGCFLFLNKEAQGYKKSVFKAIKEYLADLIEKYDIKILSAECMDGINEAENLIKHLGFTKERELKIHRYIRR
uniref:N-acetyltransferase domain-containing protein n=1 Tax=viral metagenome TaxID=1070528 RepID=A0A6M3K8Z4_9ZZZZ